jgi:hypothetical protein
LKRRGGRSRRVRLAAILGWLAYLGLSPHPGFAAGDADAARFAAHAHFDRLVVPLPPSAGYEVRGNGGGDGGALGILIPGLTASLPEVGGRRLLRARRTGGGLDLQIASGTHPHIWRIGQRLIIDIDDAAAPSVTPDSPADAVRAAARPPADLPAMAAGTPDARPEAAQPGASPLGTAPLGTAPPTAAPLFAARPTAAPPTSLHVLKLRRLPKQPGHVEQLVQLAPVRPVTVEALPAPLPDGPGAIAGRDSKPAIATQPLSGAIDVGAPAAGQAPVTVLLQPDATPLGPSILLPFPKTTGAAAFRRGHMAVAVFDAEQSLDLGQLSADPAFGALTGRLLPGGLALSMPVEDGAGFKLARTPGGWLLTLARQMPPQTPIEMHADKGVLALKASSAGDVVVLDDPATGGKLLIGTQRVAGENLPAPHESAEFVLLATWQGVAVEPRTDRLSLTPLKDGFRLGTASGPKLAMVLSDQSGRVMTRRFDLPDLPQAILQNRLTLAVRDAALTPKLSRFGARLRVAQAMLAEGLDREARTVLHAATEDDPMHASDPDAAALGAMAAFLEARAGGALPPPPADFDAAALGDSDEGKLWRALLLGGKPDPSAEAASLAATWPLLEHYPAALRRRLLPAVAEIMGKGGQDKALGALLRAHDDPSLDLQRAEWLRRQGKTDDALAWLDAVAGRVDRLLRAGALREAVELRLASKKLTPAAAADALGRQLYAWRGGPSDVALRLRVADLESGTGRWRKALSLLRETDGLFPDNHAALQSAETRLVGDLLRGDSAERLGALDLVALAEEAAPLLTGADADATLAPVLLDKLLALDLPSRAEPILQRLFDQAGAPRQKAQLGVRLATLQADRGDLKAALGCLDQSDDAALPSELVAQRALLRAKLLARSGKDAAALSVLSSLPGTEAMQLSSQILEKRGSWAEAAKVLQAMIDGKDFATLADEAQRGAILRLANDESEAGDMAGLRVLRSTEGARFATGPGAELFAVLTQDPIKGVDDLERSGRELQTVRALPAVLSTPPKNFP